MLVLAVTSGAVVPAGGHARSEAMALLSRLSPADLTNLAVEGPESPMHQAALAVLEGGRLVDAGGNVDLEGVRSHVAARLHRVPELRRVLHPTRLLEGRPLWVDDQAFDVRRHVLAARLAAPGGERAALAFAGERMAEVMDRSQPLWRIWLLEGLGPGRAGILIKLHHALADGRAMVNLLAELFDLSSEATREAPPSWTPSAPPSRQALVQDNLRRKRAAIARAGRRLRRPLLLARVSAGAIAGAVASVRRGQGAPRTSLNRPIGAARRVGVVRLPLAAVKLVAHASGSKVNDVFLSAVAGGLRELLLSRGERVEGLSLRASMAVSLHPSDDTATVGNLAGTVVVRLPVDFRDTVSLLRTVSAEAARTRAAQHPFNPVGLMLFLARAGLTRWYIRRQHLVNILTTNLPGPPVPLYFAGSRLVDAVAMPPIAGNVTVSVAALSYAGCLNVSTVADADAWPDLDVLMDGIRSTFAALAADVPTGQAAEGRSALSA